MFLGLIENHILDAPDCVDSGKSPLLYLGSTGTLHRAQKDPNKSSKVDLHVVLDYQNSITFNIDSYGSSFTQVLVDELHVFGTENAIKPEDIQLFTQHRTVLTSPLKSHEKVDNYVYCTPQSTHRTSRLCKYTLCKWPEITITATFMHLTHRRYSQFL